MKLSILYCFVTFAVTTLAFAVTPDEEYQTVAEEYIKGYLNARPLLGTSLGLHEHDGKISDYSRLSLDAELSRLHRFDDRLSRFDLAKLTPRIAIDLRILQTSIRKEIFQRQEMAIFERDPMVYARAADVNVYIKRNFAPLEDRVQAARADIFRLVVDLHREERDLFDPVGCEFEFHILHPEQLPVLLGQRVLRLGENSLEILSRERVQLDADRKASLQLRNQVRRLAHVKRAGGDEQHVIGFDLAVLRVDRTAFDDRKNVALDALA